MSDAPAQITVDGARKLDQLYREWQAFKRANGGDTGGGTSGVDLALNAPVGWIIPKDGTLIGEANRWKYGATVVSTPFAKLLDTPQVDLSSSTTFAFNTAENTNGPDSVYSGTISVVPPDDAQCGDCLGVEKISVTYAQPVLAQLFWTFFESNDPATGYWAWWFTLPNKLNYKES